MRLLQPEVSGSEVQEIGQQHTTEACGYGFWVELHTEVGLCAVCEGHQDCRSALCMCRCWLLLSGALSCLLWLPLNINTCRLLLRLFLHLLL